MDRSAFLCVLPNIEVEYWPNTMWLRHTVRRTMPWLTVGHFSASID